MSRGKHSNTLYLTQPDTADDCGHLAYDQPDRLRRLLETLQRSTGQPAAVDIGRGPQALTNTQLANQLHEHRQHAGKPRDRNDADLARLAALVAESEARHQDRLAETAYQPPTWIVEAIGERPAHPLQAAVWDDIVDQAIRYHHTHGSNDAQSLIDLEPPSKDIPARAAWLRLRRDIISARQQIEFSREMPERTGAVSR